MSFIGNETTSRTVLRTLYRGRCITNAPAVAALSAPVGTSEAAAAAAAAAATAAAADVESDASERADAAEVY
jgi:hypothetical protein